MKKQKAKWRAQPKLKTILGISVLAVVSILYLIGSGYAAYAVAMVKCGQKPVAASRFAASYSYYTPEDLQYRVSPFHEYYCTPEEAERRGFSRSPLTEASRQEAKERREQIKEAERFDTAKIDYTAYVPDIDRFSYINLRLGYRDTTLGQTFYTLKKGTATVASVRQGKVGDSYELCIKTARECEVAGTDSKDRQIKIKYSKTRGPDHRDPSFSATTRIGDTYINLERVRGKVISVEETIAIFGSMKPIEGNSE